MKISTRILFATAFTVLALQTMSPEVSAQIGGDRIKRPLNRPTVSPYLNLFRRGNSRSPILNYYNAVRPQQQSYQQDQQFSKGLERVQNRASNNRNRSNDQGGDSKNNSFRRYRMSITGHRAGFMTIGGGGAGGGDEGGGGGSFGQGDDDDQSSGSRFSGHSASFGFGNSGSSRQ